MCVRPCVCARRVRCGLLMNGDIKKFAPICHWRKPSYNRIKILFSYGLEDQDEVVLIVIETVVAGSELAESSDVRKNLNQ